MAQQTTLKPNALPGPVYGSFAGKVESIFVEISICDAALTDLNKNGAVLSDIWLYRVSLIDQALFETELTDDS